MEKQHTEKRNQSQNRHLDESDFTVQMAKRTANCEFARLSTHSLSNSWNPVSRTEQPYVPRLPGRRDVYGETRRRITAHLQRSLPLSVVFSTSCFVFSSKTYDGGNSLSIRLHVRATNEAWRRPQQTICIRTSHKVRNQSRAVNKLLLFN